MGFTFILVYVDDLVLIGNDMHEIQRIEKLLDGLFKIKDFGDLIFVLGMEVARTKEGIGLYHRKYTLDLLQDYGLLGSKPISTPMDYTLKISKDSGTPLDDVSIYRRLTRCLI